MAAANGLAGAPLTKLWLYVVLLGTMVTTTMNWRHYMRLRVVPYIVRDWQVWRCATSLVSFSTYTELAIGMLVIYQLRVVERVFGTRKYAAFLFVVGVVGQAVSVLAVWAMYMNRRTMGAAFVANLALSAAAGPYVLVFGALYQFYVHVPVQRPGGSGFMGIAWSDKWMVYFLAASMWPSSMFGAVLPSVAGVAASCVYTANVGGLLFWRFPQWTAAVSRKLVLPLLSLQTPTGSGARSTGLARAFERLDQQQNYRQAQNLLPPPEETVAQLLSMFPDAGRERVVQALQTSGNDPNRAAVLILGS
ncbi:hypothetical protein IWW48_003613 [Coemansia sp. RSA 1200]|nr:hypothetical protein IWW48_003613 [Coemansia sp. RSA 1200]